MSENEPQSADIDMKFELKKIETDPSTILKQEEIDSVTAPYIGKAITVKDLYTIVDDINDIYSKKEYMTCRAFLPPQTIHEGVVHINLVEARTGNLNRSLQRFKLIQVAVSWVLPISAKNPRLTWDMDRSPGWTTSSPATIYMWPLPITAKIPYFTIIKKDVGGKKADSVRLQFSISKTF